ncbi:MAG: S41 family peptidase [Candidatus Promineifilaceae bacterium]|nr:S41 family peptidase [Candidatus Promineifilaceae bacterium]
MKNKILGLVLIPLILLAACQQDNQVSPTLAPVVETAVPTETVEEPTAVPTSTPLPEPTAERETSTSGTDDTLEEQALQFPPAEINNDEGGVVNITGEVEYTNTFFTMGVAEPVIILEDQAGFVDRNENFLMPVESQTLGQITSDFFTSPFSYSIALPQEPQGTLRDVDNDTEDDEGVQVFAVAYWTNTFGDPYLEERDLFGGGWSTAYASTLTSPDAETKREIVGGKLLVYAEDNQQGFPSGFGDDGLLFTADDPIVTLPQGYTVVDLDTDPFTFDRSKEQVIDLIEPESSALVDLSDLPYAEAFDELVDKLSKEYAFTEYKNIDWEQIHQELRPEFERADEQDDAEIYRRALRDFARSIPDGHVNGPQLIDEFLEETTGGLGIAVRETDDGRVLVNFLTPDSPADEAGIELGAEILAINDLPVSEALEATSPHSAPFSTEHFERLQQLRYVTRFPLTTDVNITYRNSESSAEQTVSLTAVQEPESFRFSSLNVGRDGFELPVEYELLDGTNYVYAKINSFSDNELLTIQLWERMLRTVKDRNAPGLIIDMRQNAGGSGFLADQMAAYFFQEPLVLGNVGKYDRESDEFFFDPRSEEKFILPAEELRYDGAVALLIGPNCNSACEFFSYDMTLQDRAAIVGQYPTAGLGGSVDEVKMPEDVLFRFTKGRAVDPDGQIHIEGKGIPPTVQVPVNEETLFSAGDPILEAALNYLNQSLFPEIITGSNITVGAEESGRLLKGTAVEYVLTVSSGDVIDIIATSTDFDPIVAVLDEEGSLLGSNEGFTDGSDGAGFKNLEIPEDLTLLLWITSLDEEAEGEYELRIVDAGGS